MVSPDPIPFNRTWIIRINSKAYTVSAKDSMDALMRAVEAFEAEVGRDFDPCRDRFEGSRMVTGKKPQSPS
jgi:hypothetical protein